MTRKCITIVLTLCMILSASVCTFAEEPGADPAPAPPGTETMRLIPQTERRILLLRL